MYLQILFSQKNQTNNKSFTQWLPSATFQVHQWENSHLVVFENQMEEIKSGTEAKHHAHLGGAVRAWAVLIVEGWPAQKNNSEKTNIQSTLMNE